MLIDPKSLTSQVYRTYFEEPYLTATTEFYMVKAQAFLQDNGVHAYMRYAEQKLKEEEARGARYLETSADSAYKLRKCLVDELIIKYMDVILAECPGKQLLRPKVKASKGFSLH